MVNSGVIAGSIHGSINVVNRTPEVWPCLVGVLPPLADCRQYRPADQTLADFVSGAVVVSQVLSGLGGVGKTQLGAQLAHQVWTSRAVDLLIWITAGSRTSVIAGYAEAAARIAGVDMPDPERGAARLLAWLAEPRERRWLIVLDDLADPDDMTGLWPPTVPAGRTVVTTRRRDAALLAGRKVIDVDVFASDQAAAYLRNKLSGRPHRLEQAEELASDLGYLPLALAQAAAYILDRGAGMTCAQYRRRLADRRRQLAELAPHALPDQYQPTVAATWSLSIHHADQLTPVGVARPVLELAALLDPNGIPAEFFTAPAVVSYMTERLGRDLHTDDLSDTLHLLHRFSLLTVHERTGVIRMHGLVQRAVREAADPAGRTALAATAAKALLEIWPRIERGPGHVQVLRANALAVRACADDHLWAGSTGYSLLLTVGTSLAESGVAHTAAEYFEELHAEAVRRLGDFDPRTLKARHWKIFWQGFAGNPTRAVTAFEELVTDETERLGPDSPDTLATRVQLADMRGKAGDFRGAVEDSRRVLTDCFRVLGADHPVTLQSRQYVASWLGRAGDPVGAVIACEELAPTLSRVLGSHDGVWFANRLDHARYLGEAGDFTRSLAAYQKLLSDQLSALGPTHPNILQLGHHIADMRGRAGDISGALSSCVSLLDDHIRVHGPDHWYTLALRRSIALWQMASGDLTGSARAAEALASDQERALGPDHPETLNFRFHLARCRGRAGHPAEAAEILKTLLSDQLRALGRNNPDILATRAGLAYWLERAHDRQRAVAERRTLQSERIRILGSEHADTSTGEWWLSDRWWPWPGHGPAGPARNP